MRAWHGGWKRARRVGGAAAAVPPREHGRAARARPPRGVRPPHRRAFHGPANAPLNTRRRCFTSRRSVCTLRPKPPPTSSSSPRARAAGALRAGAMRTPGHRTASPPSAVGKALEDELAAAGVGLRGRGGRTGGVACEEYVVARGAARAARAAGRRGAATHLEGAAARGMVAVCVARTAARRVARTAAHSQREVGARRRGAGGASHTPPACSAPPPARLCPAATPHYARAPPVLASLTLPTSASALCRAQLAPAARLGLPAAGPGPSAFPPPACFRALRAGLPAPGGCHGPHPHCAGAWHARHAPGRAVAPRGRRRHAPRSRQRHAGVHALRGADGGERGAPGGGGGAAGASHRADWASGE